MITILGVVKTAGYFMGVIGNLRSNLFFHSIPQQRSFTRYEREDDTQFEDALDREDYVSCFWLYHYSTKKFDHPDSWQQDETTLEFRMHPIRRGVFLPCREYRVICYKKYESNPKYQGWWWFKLRWARFKRFFRLFRVSNIKRWWAKSKILSILLSKRYYYSWVIIDTIQFMWMNVSKVDQFFEKYELYQEVERDFLKYFIYFHWTRFLIRFYRPFTRLFNQMYRWFVLPVVRSFYPKKSRFAFFANRIKFRIILPCFNKIWDPVWRVVLVVKRFVVYCLRYLYRFVRVFWRRCLRDIRLFLRLYWRIYLGIVLVGCRWISEFRIILYLRNKLRAVFYLNYVGVVETSELRRLEYCTYIRATYKWQKWIKHRYDIIAFMSQISGGERPRFFNKIEDEDSDEDEGVWEEGREVEGGLNYWRVGSRFRVLGDDFFLFLFVKWFTVSSLLIIFLFCNYLFFFIFGCNFESIFLLIWFLLRLPLVFYISNRVVTHYRLFSKILRVFVTCRYNSFLKSYTNERLVNYMYRYGWFSFFAVSGFVIYFVFDFIFKWIL